MRSSREAVRLLDVNLLVALSWPHHVTFAEAQRWFGTARAHGWATTLITEAGLARLSMNPVVAGQTMAWDAVTSLIRRLRLVPGHHLWQHDLDVAEDPVLRRARVVGHRQVPDVVLAAVAAQHGGRLATLDASVRDALHPDDAGLIEVVGCR